MIPSDPLFYGLAVFAVLLTGISKSGFAGGGAVMGVPLLSIAVAPQIAAGVLLPLLLITDVINLWRFRHDWSAHWMKFLVPPAILGVFIGWLLFQYLSADLLRLLVGVMALTFAIRYFVKLLRRSEVKPMNLVAGRILGTTGGLTSFVAHAGGPAIDSFLLSQNVQKTTHVATNVYLYSIINAVKMIPYFFLGLLAPTNLATSLVLLPIVPVGIGLGYFLHSRVSQKLFQQIAYAMLILVGLKLIFDGLSAFA